MAEIPPLEMLACQVIDTFEIKSPPVPIERMLQHPRPDMWEEVEIGMLSIGFLNVKEPYSPRMSLTRLLARHIVTSAWGNSRQMDILIKSSKEIHAFARMLIMPLVMITALSPSARNPTTMSFHFEVPEEDARQRLIEIAEYL